MADKTTIPDVFIFCWYPKHWLPRSIIIDISKLDECALKQLNTIMNVGEVFEYTWKQIDKNSYTHSGIKTQDGKIYNRDDYDELLSYIESWSNMTDNFNYFSTYDDEDENNKDLWFKYAHEYYINDINSNLSPIELHKKLKSMTNIPPNSKTQNIVDYKFNVKHCALISEIPIQSKSNEEKYIKSLRFYFSGNSDTEHIKNLLLTNLNVTDVQITDDSYGFLKPKTLEDWEMLNDKKFKISDVNFYFM